ncbi:MAG: hypothetical protein AB1502_00805 [Thermodesulfobacteriota bacterium]
MRKSFSSIFGEMGLSFFLLFLLIPFIYCPVCAQSNEASDSFIQLLTPQENTEVIGKKPLIKCFIKTPFDPQKLLVLLDGTDISALLDITTEGFEHRPIGVLTSGDHTLSVTAYTQDGRELKREFTFSSRHSKTFEEAYTSNEITTLYEKLLGKSDEASNIPSWKFESNLGNESKLKEKEWEFTFKTNVRYFDQNLRATPPTEKGFSLANYLFQGRYAGKRFSFLGEAGDVTIDETSNTVQGLARRGGNLVLQFKDLNLQLRTFDVKSEQLFGFKGGTGLGTTPNDHIMGVSGDIRFFSERLKFRTIYVKGGEEGSSLGISTAGGAKEGDVLGFLLMTDFFKGKLTTEAEFDLSRFDSDTSDEFPRRHDKAYKLKVGGALGDYTYEALYEYWGPDYEVVGNQGLSKDKESYALKAGANFLQIHLINLGLSLYNDNVEKDSLYPRVYTYQGMIDYTFSKFKSLPVGLSYQKSRLDSKWEPLGTPSTRTDTDTVTGKINYIKEPWNLGFTTTYSLQNDKTHQNNDTTTVTYTFTPTYTLEHPYLSISPTLSFNRSRTHLTKVHTDTYTGTLDLKGNLLRKKVTYGVGGTYIVMRSSDGLTRQDTLSSNFNVSYLLFKNLWGFLNPSMGIRGLYNRTHDRVLRQTTNELAFFLVIQTLMSFSF